MTTVEKQLCGLIAGILAISIGLGIVVSNQIEKAGGVRGIVIQVGKEIKDISKEIADHK